MTRLAVYALCAGFAFASAALADDGALRSVLESRYAAMKAAMAAHDSAAVAAILAPNFGSIEVTGAYKRAPQMLAEVGALKADPNRVSTTTLLSIRPVDGAVVVEQKYDMKTLKAGPDGVIHHVELITLSTDTWVKPADAWLLQLTVTNDISYVADGKLVFHQAKQ